MHVLILLSYIVLSVVAARVFWRVRAARLLSRVTAHNWRVQEILSSLTEVADRSAIRIDLQEAIALLCAHILLIVGYTGIVMGFD